MRPEMFSSLRKTGQGSFLTKYSNTHELLHNTEGFTLIEIIMVIMLLAITAAIVIPRFSTYPGMQIETVSKKVVSDIRFAQSLSLSNRTTVWHRITFNAAADNYRIYNRVGGVRNPVTQESTFSIQLNSGEYIGLDIQNNFSTTFYYPLGGTSSTFPGGYVRIKKDQTFTNISVAPVTGRAS